MQILLANAKIMKTPSGSPCLGGELSKPLFQSVANDLAAEMAQLDVEELARQLDCSRAIALENWKRVKEEVKVIQPLFYVRKPNGDLKMQAVWAKSCRGAMVRYILQNQIMSPVELKGFYHESFEYNPKLGEEAYPHFVRETQD